MSVSTMSRNHMFYRYYHDNLLNTVDMKAKVEHSCSANHKLYTKCKNITQITIYLL